MLNLNRSINFKKKKSRIRDKEGIPGSIKKQGRPELFFSPNFIKGYILIGLSIILSILLFPNILTNPKVYHLGDVADRDIKASCAFLVENKELTEINREKVVKAVLSVYDFDPVAGNIVSRIKEAFKEGRRILASIALSLQKMPKEDNEYTRELDFLKKNFFKILKIVPDNNLLEIMLKDNFSTQVENALIVSLVKVVKNGVVSNKMMLMAESEKGIIAHNIITENEKRVINLDLFYDLTAAKKIIKQQLVKMLSDNIFPEVQEASLKMAYLLLKPNLTFNNRETELRNDEARKALKPFYVKIKKGEMLVREGERITPEHLLKISEQYKLLKQNEVLGRVPAMAALIAFLLYAMYMVGLLNNRKSKTEIKDLLFIALSLLSIFLLVMVSDLIFEETSRALGFISSRTLLFSIPVASGAMLMSISLGTRTAVSFSLLGSLLFSLIVGGRVDFFTYFFISSLIATYGVKDCRERGVLIKAGLKVSLANMAMALPIIGLYGSFNTIDALCSLIAGFIGGIMVGIIAAGVLPLIEMAFGYTTDIKLLELANLDNPLLRELMMKCPGTYHHSIIVSNLVEATAKAIGANPLVVRVAAYYHDIGKINKSLYFIENQAQRENKHEKLAPSMSSLILISHIKDGVELGKEKKLLDEIIDIIRQHHGTSLIKFFYEKAKEQADKKGDKAITVKEEDYRYPGPKPQTKEAGLVMLADVVEAASRSLVDPTAARIQGMVQKIINNVFTDGQLDECELTLKDLNEIAKNFNKILGGIFHHRIEYPDPVIKTANIKKGANGDSDRFTAKGSRARNTQDKVKVEESLKRLGMS